MPAPPLTRDDQTVLRRLRSLVTGGRRFELYECRHCGSSVEGPGERCPECGAAEIARFVL